MRRRVRKAAAALLAAIAAACGGGAGDADGPSATATAATSPDAQVARFDSMGLTLRGDLRLPDGSGPHPGVVLVHGSGPVSRDGAVPGQLNMAFPEPIEVLAELAEGLRDAGYAVLTYDKRTCGPFNGCADNGYPRPRDDLTVETFVADAEAAIAYLRSRPEVGSDGVAVAGHSQGASFVPALLIDHPDLVAGAMLAAPYDPIDEILADQAERSADLVASLDPEPPGAAGSVARLRDLAGAVRALRAGGGDDATMIGGASAAFWRSWLRITDGVPQLAAQATQPVLVLSGALDTTVPPAQAARWRDTLTGPHDRVTVLECVTHALNCVTQDDLARVRPADIGDTVDPRVITTLADFLDAAHRRQGGGR